MRQALQLFSMYQLAFLGITFGTILSCTDSQTNLVKQTTNDSASIIKLENDWANALINRDTKVFNNLLADDFFYTENEKMYSRAEVMTAVLSTSEKVEKAYNENMQVHLKENTAIVTGWLFVNGKSAGADFKRKYRFTDIWFKKKGRWQLIAAQDYLLP